MKINPIRIKRNSRLSRFLVSTTDRSMSDIQNNMSILEVLGRCIIGSMAYILCKMFEIVCLLICFVSGFPFGYRPICFKEDQDERYIYEKGYRYEKTMIKYKKWPTIKGYRILPIYIFILGLAAMHYEITFFILGCCCGLVFILFCMEKLIFPVIDWFIKLTKLTEEEEEKIKEKKRNRKPFIRFE